tara:strand:- start:424 stop:996 length:573 start_codon:yes stop_codon:yes gene_type:complete
MSKIKHGGFRMGAGRKVGTGKYSEPTKVMRVPASKVTDIERYILRQQLQNVDTIFNAKILAKQFLPFFAHKVPAGFPSPADDHVEKKLDLNEYLINQKEATFFITIKGDSMIDASIHDGDIVIVDRSKQARIGDIVLASIDGEFTVKTLAKHLSQPRLVPANKQYKYIDITENMEFEIWGVITGAVRKFK